MRCEARHTRVWFGRARGRSIGGNRGARRKRDASHSTARAHVAGQLAVRRLAALGSQRGQGTVEYVGLILLVALLMVGMVAAMKGFQGKQGLELAETIVDKIREAVNKVTLQVAAVARAGVGAGLGDWRRCPPARSYDRAPADVRPVEIEPGYVRTADGSALISQGETRVICTASVSDSVPRWMEGKGPRLGDRRVRDAARLDRRPQGSATSAAASRTAAGSRSSG